MHQYTFKDGRTITWAGENTSICTECDDVFNSLAAFDAHLIRGQRKKGGHARHDISKLQRNNKGYLVTSLYDKDAYNKKGDSCPHCGTDLLADDQIRMYCPYCGEELDD